ncbi:MAG: NUDIX domain-containing protein [Chloroflexota bacterium]|nr:NUDIX domain-containing protein [Chloroflexota bacterium]
MSNAELPQMAAAGGLVLCGGNALLIRKHGQWDIPKGKRKKKEHLEKCALREVAEETGLDKDMLSVRLHFCRSSYITYYASKPVNKTVDWFLMDYAGTPNDRLTPDLSENIDLCIWVPFAELSDRMRQARTYLRGEVAAAIEAALGSPAPA